MLAATVRHFVIASPSKNVVALPVLASINATVVWTTGSETFAFAGTTLPNFTIVGPDFDARAI